MSHARWMSGTSAAVSGIRPLSEEARAARDQTLSERLRQHASLLTTDLRAQPPAAAAAADDAPARSRSGSARRHSTTAVAADPPASWLPSRKSSRQSIGVADRPRSGERGRARDKDASTLEQRAVSLARYYREKVAESAAEPSALRAITLGRWSSRGSVATLAPSQTGSAGSSVALSGTADAADSGSPREPPEKVDTPPAPPPPPTRNPALEFQARPRESEKSADAATTDSDDAAANRAIASSIPPMVRKTLLDFDRIQKLRMAAEKAVRDKKIFMIHGGYPSIRLALKRRGWIEKKFVNNRNESDDEIDVSRWPMDNSDKMTIGLAEALSLKGSKNSLIMTRILRDHRPNLIWSCKREVIDFINLDRDQLVNHFPRAPFNTKIGLCSLAQGMHWFPESIPAQEFIPRAYRIGMAEEKQEFIDDFRLTACVSLLVWFKERYELHGAPGVEDSAGEVPYSVIPTALRQCQAFISICRHEDIEPSAFNRALWPHQWDNFMTNIYKILHKRKKLEMHRDENSTVIRVFYNRSCQMLKDLAQFRPQQRLDGCLNIWIVKPGSASRGRGIILMRHLEDILALVDSATQREGKWVVQKYCERPLLIYNTKFDIRQWFLVTDWNPLTVWMYKQCYLRFSSQQFNLDDLKEAIHLCNNAVQARYRNGERHAALPTENMWDANTFQQFLKGREAGHAWDQIIYPGMKNAFLSVCLATQTELEPRRGCFELYGADFLLTEDYHPWLIEVNSSPAMGASTSVTAWLCSMCLEDTIRVVVDRRRDPAADVGEFELIVQQPTVSSPRYLGIDLSLHGHRIKPPATHPPVPSFAAASLAGGAELSPQSPRGPTTQSSSPSVPDSGSRLTAIPVSQSSSSSSRQRSRSQAATVASAARNAVTAAAAAQLAAAGRPAAVAPPRGRSQSQAAPPARARAAHVSSVATTVTPAPLPAPAPKSRMKPTKKPPAAVLRRRSRTRVIQSSVRRLSVPRRSRSAIKQKMATVAASVSSSGSSARPTPAAAAAAAAAAARPAASVPRNPLEVAARRQLLAGPRAQQLVTAGEQLREPTASQSQPSTQLRGAEPAARGPVSAAASESRMASAAVRARARSVTRGGDQAARAAAPSAGASTQPSDREPQLSESRTGINLAGYHFVTSSLAQLERIRLASEEAVRRINSLTVNAARSAAKSAENTALTAAQQPPHGSSAADLERAAHQLPKVKWVSMPAAQSVTVAAAKASDSRTASSPADMAVSNQAAPSGPRPLSGQTAPLERPLSGQAAPPGSRPLSGQAAPPGSRPLSGQVMSPGARAVPDPASAVAAAAAVRPVSARSPPPRARSPTTLARGAVVPAQTLQWAPRTVVQSFDAPPGMAQPSAAVAAYRMPSAIGQVATTTRYTTRAGSPAGAAPWQVTGIPARRPVPTLPLGMSWGSPPAAGQLRGAPGDVFSAASDSWPSAAEPAARPASVGGRTLPLIASPRVGTAVSDAPVFTRTGRAAALHSPRSPSEQQAFNSRITELKSLIDRAIEETRDFLGKNRLQPAAEPQQPELPQLQRSPRPLLTPTVVDIAVRRPGVDGDETTRLNPRRAPPPVPTAARPQPTSPLSSPLGSPRTDARLTELVGLQGRRFLPTLNSPEQQPRWQR